MFTRRVASRSLLLTALVGGCGRSAQVSSPAPPIPATQAVAITDGESLIRAMHERYAGNWYRTLTFVQKTTITRASQTPMVQTWYEAMSLPGKLRIDVGDPALGNGTLFRGDSTYSLSDGRIARADTGFNELLVLGFDVYTQPAEETISILRHLGFQLSRMHTADLDGKSVYVVGATSRNDSTSKQFWIDRDRLLFVKLAERRANGQQVDLRFADYVPAGNGWIARTVVQMINGSPRVREDYTDIKADVPLDPALFDPKQWKTVRHWTK
jgi:hypothetical protein